MNKSSKPNQQHPRDAEGRFESKGSANKGHSGGNRSQMSHPRDMEGRFESKASKK